MVHSRQAYAHFFLGRNYAYRHHNQLAFKEGLYSEKIYQKSLKNLAIEPVIQLNVFLTQIFVLC